jgi:hypothetical protein
MSQSKADRLVTRITALHHSLHLDTEDDGPSPLERDLMLGYLRDLYDLYLNVDGMPTEKKAAPKKDDPKPVAKPPAPKESAPTVEMAPAAPPPPPPTKEASVPDQAPEVPDVPVPPPPAPAYAAHTAKIDPAYNRPAPNPPQPAPRPNASPEVEALFQEPEESGIGARLMRQKVSDLTRALSINNRVLFTNRLFGNSNEELTKALKELNLKGSMQYAKPTLVNLAQQYHWADEERQETAREFIELVRRRYA